MDTKPISGDGVNDSIVEEINVMKTLLDRIDELIEKMRLELSGGCHVC